LENSVIPLIPSKNSATVIDRRYISAVLSYTLVTAGCFDICEHGRTIFP